MKNSLIACIAVSFIALAGCASNDSMAEKDGMMEKDAMMEKEVMVEEESMMEKEVMAEGEVMAETNSMADLCLSKGGSLGEWPGEEAATETCRLGDGSEYPLASIASYEAFQ